jgi:hypothetical protein
MNRCHDLDAGLEIALGTTMIALLTVAAVIEIATLAFVIGTRVSGLIRQL